MGNPGFGYIISEFFAPNIKIQKNIVGFPPGIIIIFSGDIFLWPAFLHHLVHPNMSDKPRISISFNVILKWKDEYIANAE